MGYGSSDDDDEGEKETAVDASPSLPNTAIHDSLITTTSNETNEASNGSAIGPLLGPAAQSNGAAAMNDVPSPVPLAELSERDAIRFLTQAPVPATSLPPSPPGSPDTAANERFRRFLELKEKGLHFNEDLAKKTSFRNPSLLSTMMARVGIDEQAQYNTSLPLELWNTGDFPEWSYKEGLLKSQKELQAQTELTKKTLSASGKRTIEFTSETASGELSRKSTPGQQGKRRRP